MEIKHNEVDKFEKLVNQMMYDEYSKLSEEEIKEGGMEFLKHYKFWENEINNREEVIKSLKKLQNKNIDSFQRFKSFAILEYLNSKEAKSGYFYEDKQYKLQRILASLKEGKELNKKLIIEAIAIGEFRMISDFFNTEGSNRTFRLPLSLMGLLRTTDSKNQYSKLPFNQILLILDEPIVIDNAEIYSVLIRDTPLMGDDLKVITNQITIKIFGIDRNDKEPVWMSSWIIEDEEAVAKNVIDWKKQEQKTIADEWCSRETFNETIKEVRNLVSNLLNFINHPEVELITKSQKYFRDNKLKKERIGVPDSIEINLTGKLKRYINETIANNEKAWELGHKFWVRGHWMEFKDECYKNMRGKKKWILPYIKGKGELIKKDYYIGEKEQCWENQKRMIQIIQQIFPDKKIEKNNRTILEGLEIDCYIPELKIGFEYNGQQHYKHIECFHKTIEEFKAQQERDVEKNKRAIEKGIKLITIKYDEPLTEEHLKERL